MTRRPRTAPHWGVHADDHSSRRDRDRISCDRLLGRVARWRCAARPIGPDEPNRCRRHRPSRRTRIRRHHAARAPSIIFGERADRVAVRPPALTPLPLAADTASSRPASPPRERVTCDTADAPGPPGSSSRPPCRKWPSSGLAAAGCLPPGPTPGRDAGGGPRATYQPAVAHKLDPPAPSRLAARRRPQRAISAQRHMFCRQRNAASRRPAQVAPSVLPSCG
jgi:hypothetical protein